MTKEEIINKRIGGLGSSDAAMVAKIGKNGCLNDADKQRIAIMLGLEEHRQFSTKATQTGNEIEERIFEALHSKYGETIVSNPYYKSEELSKKYGFDIFNHIDYEFETADSLIWVENKATIKDRSQTIVTYWLQLMWHYRLLCEKAKKIDKTPYLMLSHYYVSDDTGAFYADNFSIEKIIFNLAAIEYAHFDTGFEVIAEAIKNFVYEPKDELYAENLPEKIQNRLVEIKGFFNQISEAEKQIDLFKSTMLNLMIEEGVKSIKNEFFSLTVVPEGVLTTFDKKKFEQENPSLAAQYHKQSKRKVYLIIKNH